MLLVIDFLQFGVIAIMAQRKLDLPKVRGPWKVQAWDIH